MPGRKSTLYIEDDLIKEGRKIAIEFNTSLSQIVNDLLKEFIEKHKSTNREE